MQGITSDGGAIYFSTGSRDSTGTKNKIASNLVHDVLDSSAIDTGIPGYGYGGHGIYLDNKSAAIEVENNVIVRVSDSSIAMSEGPPKGYPANVFRNNILASARKSSFKFPSPWSPEGCGEKQLRVSFVNNIFHFDSKGTQVIDGCSYSCGVDHNQFENFQGNLYWRVGGGFSTDPKAFQAMVKAPADPAKCQPPANPEDLKQLSFADWQSTMKEDTAGTAAVDPGFGKNHQPKDYLLTKSPVAGFDHVKTNDTIHKAGRSHPVILPPPVAATFPAFSFKD